MALAHPAGAEVTRVASDVERWLAPHQAECDTLILNDVLEGVSNRRASQILSTIRRGKWKHLLARTTTGFMNGARRRVGRRERVPIDVGKIMGQGLPPACCMSTWQFGRIRAPRSAPERGCSESHR